MIDRLFIGIWLWACLMTGVSAEELPARAALGGTVTDASGEPVADAIVIKVASSGGPWTPSIARTQTDASGNFQFASDAIPPGLKLVAYAEGHAIESIRVSSRGEAPDGPIDIQLGTPATIRIRVVDEAGRPIAGAVAGNVYRAESRFFHLSCHDWEALGLECPRSDADGWFEISHQHPTEPLKVQIEHPEYVIAQIEKASPEFNPNRVTLLEGDRVAFVVSCDFDPGAVADARIEVSASDERGHYWQFVEVGEDGRASVNLADRHATIKIHHPALYGRPWYFYHPEENQQIEFSLHRTGTVRGRVIDPRSDEGVEQVSVRFVRENKVFKMARTDSAGHYEAELPDLEFTVGVESSDLWEAAAEELSVTVEAGQVVELEPLSVTPKPPVRGRVVNADGEPVQNAIVVTGFRGPIVLTDVEGRFSYRSRERHLLFAQVLHPYEPLSKFVVVNPGDPEMKLVLEREDSLVGFVTDEAGQPVGSIPVDLSVSLSNQRHGVRTRLRATMSRADGSFRFRGLTPGATYRPEVRGQTRASYSDTPVEQGASKKAGEPTKLSPIVLTDRLLKEARELAEIEADARPDDLLPLDITTWISTPLLSGDDFQGRPVLLCVGTSSHSVAVAEIAHQLYADRGLMVVGVASRPTPLPLDQEREIIAQLDPSFPFGIDDGSIWERFARPSSSRLLLFDADGKFYSEVQRGGINTVRLFVRYHLRD